MKLVTFLEKGERKIGRLEGDKIIDLSSASLPDDMIPLISCPESLKIAQSISGESHLLSDLELLSPIPNPKKIIAIGLNYKDHIEETGLATPEFPMFFNKQSTAVNGPYNDIHLPKVSDKLDYEQWGQDKLKDICPLARWQTPEEIAATALFLASTGAANITGQTINVDGGIIMHS